MFMYVDKNVRITGVLNNEKSSYVKTIEYNVNLRKGWNTMILTMLPTENGEIWKYAANNEPSNMIWAVEFFIFGENF